MNAYALLVLVHVLGALGVFAALAMEAVWLRTLRLAETPASALVSMRLLPLHERVGAVSMLATLATGIWAMAVAWGHEAWLVVAFVTFVALGAVGGAVSGRRVRRLRSAFEAASGSDLLGAVEAIRSSAALSASLRIRIALGVGIVALMVLKPAGGAVSIAIAVAAALAGVAASLPLLGRRAPIAERGAA
jgi:hypothetical protein